MLEPEVISPSQDRNNFGEFIDEVNVRDKGCVDYQVTSNVEVAIEDDLSHLPRLPNSATLPALEVLLIAPNVGRTSLEYEIAPDDRIREFDVSLTSFCL